MKTTKFCPLCEALDTAVRYLKNERTYTENAFHWMTQEQKNDFYGFIEFLEDKADACYQIEHPKPEQDYEPVAWMLKIKDGKGYRLKSFTHIERRDVEIGLEKAKGFADIEIVPLYCRRQRAMSEHDEPFAYINEKEVLYVNGLKANNLATEWKSNLGLTKEPKDVGLYLHPVPRKPFVRLSEEEVTEVLTSAYDMYAAICAVENRLVEKNK